MVVEGDGASQWIRGSCTGIPYQRVAASALGESGSAAPGESHDRTPIRREKPHTMTSEIGEQQRAAREGQHRDDSI